MRRLLLGLGVGSALAYGWRRLMGTAEQEPEPSWQGTDNDPEDRAMTDVLHERTRETTAPVDYAQSEEPSEKEAAEPASQ